ncbi:MAG: hypothetical protein ACLUJG_15495 [Lawsonibacter sp.]
MSTIKEYLEEIQGRPVAVIGMGVSNTPLIKMLLRAGAEVTVRDRVPAGAGGGAGRRSWRAWEPG